MNDERKKELHAMLMERRREVAGEIKERMKDNRDENDQRRSDKVRDLAENSEVNLCENIELALLQIKTGTLTRIDQALGRLMQGLYGYCLDCGEEISEKRLRALPFAVLCKDCQETHEATKQSESEQVPRWQDDDAFPMLDLDPDPGLDL